MGSSEAKVGAVKAKVGAAILPLQSALFAVTWREATQSYTYQRSFLPYLSIEFVRLGAERVAIPAWDPAARELGALPADFASHIESVDANGKIRDQVQRFLEPVFAEIPVEFEWGDVLVKSPNQEDPAVVAALVALRKSLRHFVVGIEERLHVEMDVERVKKHLEILDRRLRTPSARLAVARFSGVLQSYEQVAVESIRFESPLEAERVTGFLETIEQPEYQAMSEELAALGVPGKAKQSVAAIEKLTRWLQRRLQRAIKVVAVPLSILTLGKLKLHELGELVRDAAYFPALTSFSAARADAIKRFRESEGISTTPEQDGDQAVVHKGKLFITMPAKVSSPDALIEAARTTLGAKPVYEDDDDRKR